MASLLLLLLLLATAGDRWRWRRWRQASWLALCRVKGSGDVGQLNLGWAGVGVGLGRAGVGQEQLVASLVGRSTRDSCGWRWAGDRKEASQASRPMAGWWGQLMMRKGLFRRIFYLFLSEERGLLFLSLFLSPVCLQSSVSRYSPFFLPLSSSSPLISEMLYNFRLSTLDTASKEQSIG